MDDEKDNVFNFNSIKGGKEAEKEDDTIPENEYVITDIDGDEFYASGFMIFTPHHCAIMHDFGKGPIPMLVVPLIRIKAAELNDEV